MGNDTTILTITQKPDGTVSVNGPIHDGILCFGLLEVAKDVIREHIKKKNESGIVPVILLPGNGGRR